MTGFVDWFESMIEERLDQMAEKGQDPGWIEAGTRGS
jgi:hypothetical protein